MNEAEFIVRRIVKEADAWSKAQYEEKKDAPTGTALFYANKRAAQVDLIQHIIDTFMERENDDK